MKLVFVYHHLPYRVDSRINKGEGHAAREMMMWAAGAEEIFFGIVIVVHEGILDIGTGNHVLIHGREARAGESRARELLLEIATCWQSSCCNCLLMLLELEVI